MIFTWKRAIVMAAVLFCASCGGSPVAPSPAASLFRTGVYTLSLTASDFISIDDGPLVTACPGSGASGIHSVNTNIAMTLESGVWHGRPTSPAGGSFNLQFVDGPAGPSAPGDGPGVIGTVTGLVLNTFSFVPPVADTRVMLGGETPATFNGGVSRDGTVASGLVSGLVVFGTSSGMTVTCNSGRVGWLISQGGF